jgi:hypothetical protein
MLEPNLDWTGVVAERKIQDAMEAGEFDNLPGKGQPLDLDSDALVPAHQRVVNRILKNARALPEWLQMEKDIERETGLLGPTRERALRGIRHARNPASRARIAERFRMEHRERLDLINTLILKYNYIVPNAVRRAYAPYNLRREMAALDEELARETP